MVRNAVGKPVQGDDFFDRKRESEQIWTRLETDDVLLLAPRRVGKTSLMYRLREAASERQMEALYVSVADATTELTFARKLLTEIGKHERKNAIAKALKKSAVARFFSRVKKVGVVSMLDVELADEAEQHWSTIGEAIIGALHSTGRRWLLLIDELPIFVLALLREDESGSRARNFLNWFRTIRQSRETSNVRWLLAGSIGLDTVARRKNLGDTINDLFLYSEFGAFSEKSAFALLDALGSTHGISLDHEVKSAICRRIGWLIPYHLQIFFAELRSSDDGSAITVNDVDEIYERLLSPAKKSYFDYWKQRLHEELGSVDGGRARALLDAISSDDNGATRATLSGVLSREIAEPAKRDHDLTYLIDVLVSDGYLRIEGGRHLFLSNLLRDYWRRSTP